MKIATPKQVALLTYLGFKGANQLDVGQAAEMIDAFIEQRYSDPAVGDLLFRWQRDKHLLRPDLYGPPDPEIEIRESVEAILAVFEQDYRAFVRARHVGCSERLTRQMLADATSAAVRHGDFKRESPPAALIYELLGTLHPGSVDGRPPARQEIVKKTLPPIRRSPRPKWVGGQRRGGVDWTVVVFWTLIGIAVFGAMVWIFWAMG